MTKAKFDEPIEYDETLVKKLEPVTPTNAGWSRMTHSEAVNSTRPKYRNGSRKNELGLPADYNAAPQQSNDDLVE